MGMSQSGSQEDMSELLDLCSGVFADAEEVVPEAEVSGDSEDEEAELAEQAAASQRARAAAKAAAGVGADGELVDDFLDDVVDDSDDDDDDAELSDGEVVYGMVDD